MGHANSKEYYFIKWLIVCYAVSFRTWMYYKDEDKMCDLCELERKKERKKY